MAHQSKTELTGVDQPRVIVVPDDSDGLSGFPSERGNAAADAVRDNRTAPQLRVPGDNKGTLGLRGEIEQLCALAARLEGQHERLTKGLSDTDARSAAVLAALGNAERQAAALTAELDNNGGGGGVRGELEQLCALAARLEGQHERFAKELSETDARFAAALDALGNVERQTAALTAELDNHGGGGVRGEIEQLCALAARLEGQHERLAKGLSETDTRSAAALDALRNVERQVAALTGALNRLEAQSRALLDARHVPSRTDRAHETETLPCPPFAAPNVAETRQRRQWWVTGLANRCMQWWATGIKNRRMQWWVTGIANRRIPATGLLAVVLVGLAIVPSLRRINQIRVAPIAVSATTAGDPAPSRTTDISLPFEQELKIPDPPDAPRVPNRTDRVRSSSAPPVKRGAASATAGSLKVPNQANRTRSSTPPDPKQPRAPGYVGNLAVHSSPPGATVLVNGRSAGVTPLQLTGLPARNHLVWVELSGYERWTNSVLVPADRSTRVSVTLQPVRTAAAVR
jgi:hypothetical protein